MRAAWVVIVVALVFASGCAQTDWIDRTLVTVDVTGVWEGHITSANVGRQLKLTLVQSGSKVTGQMATAGSGAPGPVEGPLDGTVTGDIFRFEDTRGRLKAELQVNADEMTGSMTWQFGPGTITLHRRL
jgi:hypothetical protein